MPNQYLLHLPDGTQYGPVDRATFETWNREGRLPADTLVWPEGAPEWLSLERALAVAAARPAAPSPAAPSPVQASPVQTSPAQASPAQASPVQASPAQASPAQASPAQASPAQASPAQPSTEQPSTAQPSAVEQSVTPVPVEQPSPAQPTAPVRPASRRPATPPPPEDDRPDTQPSMRTTALDAGRARGGPGADALRAAWRPLAMTLVGVLVVFAVVGGLWAVLRPFISRRQAMAAVQSQAVPDRRVEDAQSGLVVDLPTGWVALRRENPFVARPEARLVLAQPAASAFGAVSVAVRPRHMDNLDAHLDELLQARLPRLPSQKELGRADVQLGRGQGRLVRTTWDDGLTPMQGATVAFADGYDLFSLDAWAPASVGDAFETEVKALCQGIAAKGQVSARLDESVDRLAVDVPELSRDALRLLVAERLSEGRGLDDVPTSALRAVNRGLDALAPAEAAEMRGIYQQVWDPVPEEERVRLASLMTEIKAGRTVAPQDVLALRAVLKTGVLALPEDRRTRLQELSGRAVRQSLLLP